MHVLALIKSLFMHANLQLMAFACAHAAFDEHQEESMNRETSDVQVSVSAGPKHYAQCAARLVRAATKIA